MRFLRYLVVAVESILAHKLRAILTMLGIIIGVASVTTTVGMGQGLQKALVKEVEGEGINLIAIFSRFDKGQALTSGDAAALANAALHPEIEAVAPIFLRGARLVYGDKSIDVQVKGTTASYEQVRNLAIASGRFFTHDEVESQRQLVVITHAVARALFADAPPVGQMIRVGAEPMRVVGVLANTSGGLFGQGSFEEVYVPISLAQGRLARAPRYRGEYVINEINVQVVSSDQIRIAEYNIERTLRLRHNLDENDENDFFIFSQERGLEFIATITRIISVFLGSIGAVSLLVGGIGIMNIMLVSVTERTREIGLRKALGAQDNDILLQFLIEAIVLTVLGGAIGVGLSYGVGALIGRLPAVPFQVFIGMSTWILAMGVSAGCGLVFGLYPAIRATRLDPIDALRYE